MDYHKSRITIPSHDEVMSKLKKKIDQGIEEAEDVNTKQPKDQGMCTQYVYFIWYVCFWKLL